MTLPKPLKTKGYLPRYLDLFLDELFGDIKAISIDGARSIGKSETAKQHVDYVYRLDDPEVCQAFELSTKSLLTAHPRICIDEWQNYPESWNSVRRLVDEKTTTRFLLTGSVTPPTDARLHTGAGRILSTTMRPLSLAEREGTNPTISIASLFAANAQVEGTCSLEPADYAQQICASGFPEINPKRPRLRRLELESYIERITEKEVNQINIKVRQPQALRDWMAAYGAASSTTTSFANVLKAATAGQVERIARNTAGAYREALRSVWILDPIPAWTPTNTPLPRLSKGDKHQLCDPALAASLLHVTEDILVSDQKGAHELFGQLFESLAMLSLRAAADTAEAKVYHLRNQNGDHEIDAIMERYDGKVLAFEVKLATTTDPSDAKHLHWLEQQIGNRLVDKVIITAGKYAYRREDGVAVIPLGMLY